MPARILHIKFHALLILLVGNRNGRLPVNYITCLKAVLGTTENWTKGKCNFAKMVIDCFIILSSDSHWRHCSCVLE